MGYFKRFIKGIVSLALISVSAGVLAQSNTYETTPELSGPDNVNRSPETNNQQHDNSVYPNEAVDSDIGVSPQRMEDLNQENHNDIENPNSSETPAATETSPTTY